MSSKEISATDATATWEPLLRSILEWNPEPGDKDVVVRFVPPPKLFAELKSRLEEGRQNGSPPESVLETVKFVLRHCVNTSHPLWVNQLYGGVHPLGLAASFLVEKMNTNAHTFEAAPVFVLAEGMVLGEARKLFYEGVERGDGIFAPGGSFANMYGFIAARHAKFPQAKETGFFGLPPLVLFTSEESHYSVSKAAVWMGLGLDNVVKVPTNREGQMKPEALQVAIQEVKASGRVPLAVNATAGTTVLGAFDPLIPISKVCEDEGVWLHVDAAWGGSFIFSPRLRNLHLRGISRADSIAWNAHKMLGAPLQCSLFLSRHEDILRGCNSLGPSSAPYLFQQDKSCYEVAWDGLGDKSFQCGRKADGFKLWLMWVGLGLDGFQTLIESAEAAAQYFYSKIAERKEEFLPYLDGPQTTNVFFWYIPPRLRGSVRDEKWWGEISKVTVGLKERMVFDGGRLLLGYAPLPHKGLPNALRLVLPAYVPKSTTHMDTILKLITTYGEDL